MRKLLLATAASLSTLLAGGAAQAQALEPVAPGTIVVHLNGYLQFGLDVYGSSANTVGAAKLNSVATNGDLRLYPGFDAVTLNGIAYGAQVEIRTAKSNSGQGAQATTGTGGTAGLEGLYVKRAYGYLGTSDVGYIRLGQTDSAFTLLQSGVIETFGDGSQWTGDGTAVLVLPSNASAASPFMYADQSAVYATDKVVYISPKFVEPVLGGAFSGSVGFEPSSNGLKEGYGACSSAAVTCAAISSINTPTFSTKARKNTFDIAGAYAVKLGSFTTKASVGFLDGAPIKYTGALSTDTGGVYTSNLAYRLDNIQVFEAGAQTTYAGLFDADDSLTVGANIKAGQTLNSYVPKVVGTRDALGYIIGASYALGPYVLGGSFFDEQSAGSYVPEKISSTTGKFSAQTEAQTLSEYGIAVGGNYVIGKDLSLYAQYLYDHLHQPGNSKFSALGNGQGQVLSLGGTFKW